MQRSTWILLIVFGILIVFSWLFTRYKANNITETATSTPLPTSESVYNLTSSQIDELIILDNSGKNIDFYRETSNSNNWAIRDIPADKADNVAIDTAISGLLTIQVIDKLNESIGMASPAYTMTMETVDGNKIITYVGAKNAIGTGYYVQVDSGPIIIVSNLTMDSILNFIQEPPLLATPTPLVSPTELGTPIAPLNQGTPTP
jgi:hypothetical protein